MKSLELRSRKWRPRCRNMVYVGVGPLAGDGKITGKVMTQVPDGYEGVNKTLASCWD